MRRVRIALLLAVCLVAAVILLAVARNRSAFAGATSGTHPSAKEVELAMRDSSARAEASKSTGVRLDEVDRDPSRTTQRAPLKPDSKPTRSFTYELTQSSSPKRPELGGWKLDAVDETGTRNDALSWCAIVGIADEKRKDVTDLVLRTQRKWRNLCTAAGSSQAVDPVALDELRAWRRDELGRIVGSEAADAFIAGIRSKQGF